MGLSTPAHLPLLLTLALTLTHPSTATLDLDPASRSTSDHGDPCTSNLDCNATSFLVCDLSDSTCQCQADTTLSAGQCRASLYAPCDTLTPIITPSCDSYNFLECSSDHRCRCKPGTKDNGFDECRVPLGETCALDLPYDDREFLVCGLDYKCKCYNGLVENEEGKCRAGFGWGCSVNLPPCDESNYLICRARYCMCMPGTQPIQGECLAQINRPCNTVSPPTPACDPTSFLQCNEDHLCDCKEGLSQTEFFECRVGLGLPCDEVNDLLCDIGSSLACEEGLCQCKICPEEGIFPDPFNCTLYHRCGRDEEGEMMDEVGECEGGKVWCTTSRSCEGGEDCPCKVACGSKI